MRIYFHKPYQEHGNFWQWLAVAYCTTGLGLLSRRIGHKIKGGGTIGSIVGLGYAAILEIYHLTWLSFILVPVFFGVAIFAIPPAERVLSTWWGPMRRHKGKHLVVRDYNAVNIDEVIPGLIIGLSSHHLFKDWLIAAICTTLIFRVIDAKKPWPVGWVEKALERFYPWDVLVDDIIGVAMSIAAFDLICRFFSMLIHG